MKKAELPFVSLVTVNWNGLRFLEKLLPCLENQTYPRDRYEIIMVDNDSQRDDSVNYVKTKFPRVKIYENNHNDGFARGCNLGMKISQGDYIVLINNDTEPTPTWLENLVACAVKQQAGAVVSKLMYANKRGIINNAGSILEPNSTWPIKEIGANQPDGPDYNKVQEITALCGASLLLSRKMLNDIGLFDERFFMYFEDGDLSWRGQKAGWKYYYCPSSVVYHEHSGSSVEHSDFFTFYVARNRLQILLKHARLVVFLKAGAIFGRDFFVQPLIKLLKRDQTRHQLRNLRLGLRISGSFLVLLPAILLKRFGLLKEQRLA